MKPKEKIIVTVDPLIKHLIPEYLNARRKDVPALEQALKKEDYHEIRSIAHGLKGTGGGFGFQQITVIGKEMESAVFDRNNEKIKSLIAELKDYLDRVEVV